MILTCSSCEARFNVKPEALLPNGRTVRCGKCGHTWREMPPEDIPKRIEEVAPPPAVSRPDGIGGGSGYGDVDGVAGVPVIEGLGNEAPGDDGFERRAGRTGSMAAWGAVVGIAAVVLGGGYFARNAIIDVWPPASMLYRMAGLAPGPGFGLELRNVAPTREREGGTAVLVISGEVVNTSSRSRPVPTLQGSLLDAGRNEIHSWTFEVDPGELAPGQTGTFNTRVPNPPEGARRTEVTFAEGKRG